MPDAGHDAVFVEDAARLRPRLERCARVLHPGVDGDPAPALRAVDQALAATYSLAPDADRTIAAFRALLRPRSGATGARTPGDQRIALLDVQPTQSGDLRDDLAALGPTSLAVLVLALIGELSADEIGRVIGAPRARVEELYADAIARVARLDRGRANPAELRRQLARLAGPTDPVASAQAGVGDLARGQAHERRGRHRRVALAGAAAVVVTLVAGLAIQGGTGGEVANAPAPTPAPSSSTTYDPWRAYRCNPTSSDCRTIRTARWRSRVAEVVVSHLDPKRSYFSDMSYELRSQPESTAFWAGRDGALDLTISGGTAGSTEVRVQIATSRSVADRCGRRTEQRCESITFMNGGRFLIAGTATSDGPVEIQYAADSDTVITVVARNVGSGKRLEIDSGELVQLVSDARMQLPRR